MNFFKKLSIILLIFLVCISFFAFKSIKKNHDGNKKIKKHFVDSIYSKQPTIGLYQDYLLKNGDLPADGIDPILGTGTEKGIITKKGFQFKDSDGDGELDPYEDWRLSPRERAINLISQMSAEQKLGLLNWRGNVFNTYDEGYLIPGLNEDGTTEEGSVAHYLLAGYRHANTNLTFDPMDTVKYFNNVQGLCERLDWGIPHFFTKEPGHDMWYGNELPTNKLSMWPFYMGLGAIDDLKVTKEFGEIMRKEFRMSGRHGIFGPMADLATELRWARIQHAIHAKGDIVANHIEVLVKALQGYYLDKNDIAVNGAVSIIKHFPGTGSVEEGMDSHTYAGRHSVFPGNNFEEHLKPFIAAIKKAKAGGVMTCYSIFDTNDFEPVGSAYSKKIVTDLLKGELGFDGAIVTDSGVATLNPWGMEDFTEAERLTKLLEAGVYQYLPSDTGGWWAEAYGLDLITDEQIDNAAIHAVELQFKLGLFENPYVDVEEAETFWDPEGKQMKKRLKAGYEAMKKAMVLCENPKLNTNVNLLPIKGENIVYTAGVDSNGNGKVDVYFDSAYPDADSGQAKTYAISTEKQYININFVEDISKADIAIVRIYARGGTYFGTQGGIPLDFESLTYVWDRDTQTYTTEKVPVWEGGFPGAELAEWKFSDWSFVGGAAFLGQGYRSYLGAGESIAAVNKAIVAKESNPGLKIIVGMTASRPGIVSSFLDDIDGLFIDFAATDQAFLDVVFGQDGSRPEGKLPVEIPADIASVEAQFEDVPGDTVNPTYEIGYGLKYDSRGNCHGYDHAK